MKPRIIIFSGNEIVLEDTVSLFEKNGFESCGFSCSNEDSIDAVYRVNPDLILLDLEIEHSDGIELCLRLRSENRLNAFVVLFSEHTEDYIQVEAFKAGADDYVVRPVNPRILVKRLKALLKRKPINTNNTKPSLLSYKSLKIDRDSYVVISENREVVLPRKEFEMLYLFLNEPQKVFTREEIYQNVWRKEESKNDRIIDVHIRKIREKIGVRTIKTVKGVGYQLA